MSHNSINSNASVNVGTSVVVGLTVAQHPRLVLRPLWFVLLFFGLSQLFGFGWTLLGIDAGDLHTPTWFYFLFGLTAFFTSEGYWIVGRLIR